jgi:hypothetical protein
MIGHRRKQADTGRQRPTLDNKGNGSRQSLAAASTFSRHYDNRYRKKRSRHCVKVKTCKGAQCSTDLAMVFHPPPPGERIQAGKLVLPRKDPPSGRRAYAGLLGKVCVGAPDCPPGAANYTQTIGDSARAPSGTVHFGELLAILFCRPGQHHRARAGPARIHRMPEHGGRPWLLLGR